MRAPYPLRSAFEPDGCDLQSALTSLEARVLLVDDVHAALAANQTVIAMTGLERFQRILDLHFSDPQRLPGNFGFARYLKQSKSALQGALL